jgi:hypothetical protein
VVSRKIFKTLLNSCIKQEHLMKKNLVLINEQNNLKDQMAGYRSLPEYILDVPGAMLQRLFNPETARARGTFLPLDASEQQEESFPSYWLTGAIIAIITFLVGWLISIANGYLPVGEELKLTLWSARPHRQQG